MDWPTEEYSDGSQVCSQLSPVIEMPPGEKNYEYPEEDTNLLPCSICARTFKPSSLQRHEKVCEKLQSKRRKVFDSTKQRQDGIDNSSLTGSVLRDIIESPTTKTKSRWREKHQEFLRTIRAAKTTSEDESEGDGTPQRTIPSDYVQCPHCERYFGPKAADRHINWCSEQRNRLPKYHTNEDAEATHRLKTRTKYIPPKPGQNGWRAPKRKDVISSIPPPNVGANITPPGRLISPPPPAHRQISPPPTYPPPHAQRHWSPPSSSPSRKGSLVSLPPGPPKYGGTSSLGRTAGKHFSAMMQSVTGYSPGYGVSSGYGTPALYGSLSGTSNNRHQSFNRSASLRLPRRRPTGGARMARHRDLASDMLASVSCEGIRAKREEPEGDESHDISGGRERFSYKLDDAPYDPYSAAELQFQDLLSPSKSGAGLRSDFLMGSTGSLQGLGLKKRSFERDLSPQKPSSLRGIGSISLCSLRLDSLDIAPHDFKSPGEDSSEAESLGDSSHGVHSPEHDLEELLTISVNEPKSSSRFLNETGGPQADYSLGLRRRNLTSPNKHLTVETNEPADRKVPDGSYSFSKSPSPPFHFDSFRRSLSKERSPSPPYKTSLRPASDFKTMESVNSNYGWTSSENSVSPNIYSRYFGGSTQTDSCSGNKLYATTSYDTLKALRTSLEEENKSQKTALERLDETAQRVSSGSSTDSSLPPLSSPSTSASVRHLHPSSATSSTLHKFCYECGNKHPMVQARFCCNCGAPRVAAAVNE